MIFRRKKVQAWADEMEHLAPEQTEEVNTGLWLEELTREFPELNIEPTGETVTQVLEDFAEEIGEGIGRTQRMPAKWEDINQCEECGTITPGPICCACAAEANAEAIAEDDALELKRGVREQD